MSEPRVFNLIPAQAGFIQAPARYPAYVGAWGTGKSASLIIRAVMHSEQYPGNLGVIFRKEFTDLRDSTIRDFETYTGLKLNSERAVKFANGSEILFRHLEEMNNIKNMNLGWAAIEQAEEMETDEEFILLQGRIRRAGFPHWCGIVANTDGRNWIWKLWKNGRTRLGESALFEAESADAAAYIPPDTMASWKALEFTNPAIWRRFVKNSWDEADMANLLINPTWVRAAEKADLALRLPIRRLVSVDVARYGDDKTVFYAIEGDGRSSRVIAFEEHNGRSIVEVAALAQLFAQRHECETYAIDEIGVGGGVVDILMSLKRHVIPVNSSERATAPDKCYNRRTEIYSTGAAAFEAGRVELMPGDEPLCEELSWARYKVLRSNGFCQVEPKDDIKERHGRSPDRADSLLQGLWALPQARIWKASDKYSREHSSRSRTAPNVSALG